MNLEGLEKTCDVLSYENQAHITMSVQLPRFPATAFSQTDLFLT